MERCHVDRFFFKKNFILDNKTELIYSVITSIVFTYIAQYLIIYF